MAETSRETRLTIVWAVRPSSLLLTVVWRARKPCHPPTAASPIVEMKPEVEKEGGGQVQVAGRRNSRGTCNDWLQLVPQMHLDINENSAQYRIRKARKPGQLSTLEAISCVLSVRYDTTPLDNVFEAFQKQFQSFQNDSSI